MGKRPVTVLHIWLRSSLILSDVLFRKITLAHTAPSFFALSEKILETTSIFFVYLFWWNFGRKLGKKKKRKKFSRSMGCSTASMEEERERRGEKRRRNREGEDRGRNEEKIKPWEWREWEKEVNGKLPQYFKPSKELFNDVYRAINIITWAIDVLMQLEFWFQINSEADGLMGIEIDLKKALDHENKSKSK